jgi:hypothetical protein
LVSLPWAIGLGVVLQRLSQVRGLGVKAAIALAMCLAVLFTADTVAWYRRLGWIDERCFPVGRGLNDPVLDWLNGHPELRSIYGGYWDVYRLSFFTGGRVRGVPFPFFPNRFPEWSEETPGGRPEIMIARLTPDGQYFVNTAAREGGKVLYRGRGLVIMSWPVPKPMLPTQSDGRAMSLDHGPQSRHEE